MNERKNKVKKIERKREERNALLSVNVVNVQTKRVKTTRIMQHYTVYIYIYICIYSEAHDEPPRF